MPFYDTEICEALQEDFLEYTGHVMQERSLPDARDGLKDGARKILYSQYRNKNDHKHNFIKGQAAVGRVLIDGFLHGDASAYASLVRLGKPYAVPYVLEEIQGNGGNQTNPDSHAAGRYLEIRQSPLAAYLFKYIEKNAIDEWYWNYSNTLELPRVLPTVGFYPIVNGVSGISVGLSTSIPSTNLREVNQAIITLIKNPNADFDQIYCAPDFPMGGFIINGAEVKESFRTGTGKAVRIRANLEYNPDKHIIIATQIPFSVYTDTIDEQLTQLINSTDNPGIEKYIDATNDEGARINIYLEKNANINKVKTALYKRTSLESSFGINFIMLDNGRFPRVFSWKEALLTYINHIRQCKYKATQFDLDKALARKNIVDGLIKAYSIIDEVVATIRASANPQDAANKLILQFQFNEEQAKAILSMKLSSLTKLDIVKLNDEKVELERLIQSLQHLLNDSTALDEELIKILREVADQFGDARRTKILDLANDAETAEPIKEDNVSVMLFNNNMIRIVPTDELQNTKRGRKGVNLKPPKNADLLKTLYTTNTSNIAAITNTGKMYYCSLADLEYNQDYSVYELINLKDSEKVLLLIDATSFYAYSNLVTVSKLGYIKKTAITEYNVHTKRGTTVAKLDANDQLIGVYLSQSDEDCIFIAGSNGYYNFYSLQQINPTGRNSRGVKGIKLTEEEVVQSATIIKSSLSYRGILSINTAGYGKITPLNDFNLTSRAVKGNRIMDTKNEQLACLSAIIEDQEKVFLSANNRSVLLSINTIPVQNRVTSGVLLIDARDTNTTIEIME